MHYYSNKKTTGLKVLRTIVFSYKQDIYIFWTVEFAFAIYRSRTWAPLYSLIATRTNGLQGELYELSWEVLSMTNVSIANTLPTPLGCSPVNSPGQSWLFSQVWPVYFCPSPLPKRTMWVYMRVFPKKSNTNSFLLFALNRRSTNYKTTPLFCFAKNFCKRQRLELLQSSPCIGYKETKGALSKRRHT